MAKTAVVTDTNSGMPAKEAEKMHVFVVPMPFYVGGETYYEGINLTQKQFYTMLEGDVSISTSQPSPESLMNVWDRVLTSYDELVYIPMSSGLSGSCQSAAMLSSDYDGRVQVVDNQRISVTQRQSVLDALLMIERGYSALQVKQRLEETKFESSIYIMLETLKYLKKGGRITPAAAAIGTALRVRPVLTIQGEKLDAFRLARTKGHGEAIMKDAVRKDAEERFGGLDPEKVWLAVAYSGTDKKVAEEWRKDVEKSFPGFRVHMDPLSLSVSCHIGPGALAVTVTKKLDIEDIR
ncbi:MAG: DegV family protein [Lachnospiraceae bacterium]|nr:DegV family protein [Lachnospiraceae bacterium]